MSKTGKYIKRTLLTIAIAIPIWLFAVILRAPVIPLIETNYYIKGDSTRPLHGAIIKQDGPATIQLQVPDYYPAGDQCIDIWFGALDTAYSLSLEKCHLSITAGDKMLTLENQYLFWDDGSSENKFTIDNYLVQPGRGEIKETYVYHRSVFDLSSENEMTFNITIRYKTNNTEKSFQKTLQVVKNRTLTWNRFRAH